MLPIAHRGRRPVRAVWLLLFAALQLACGEVGLEERMAIYASRVGRVVDAEVTPAEIETTRLPRRRDRWLVVEDHRVGVLDFLSLQGCRLGELAGYRNSPLGRVMPPTRRLIYELEVLEAGELCLKQTQGERGARLRTLLETKRAELPLHLWNAVWAGPELEGFLSMTGEPSLGRSDQDAGASLREIEQRLEGDVVRVEDAIAIEAALGRLRDEPTLGVGLRRVAATRHYLQAVADWLERETAGSCRGRAAALSQVFEESYLSLQPELVRLDRNVGEILPALEAIHRHVAKGVTESNAMAAYGRDLLGMEGQGLWKSYRAAVLRHAAAWGPLLHACKVLPGSSRS